MNRASKCIDWYNLRYNTNFKIGYPYYLWPDSEQQYGFYNEWPSNGKGGVYLILDPEMNVIYVGESKSFGSRFSKYFSVDENKKCVLKQIWRGNPAYIITIEAPEDAMYERLSLEAYLIRELTPIDNAKIVG